MNASSPCRLRLEQPRIACWAFALLAPLLLTASFTNALPWLARSVLAVCALAGLAYELWCWARWRGLALSLPDRVWLQGRDGQGIEAEWLGARRLGPLWQMDYAVGERRGRLLLWLPTLASESRRELLRAWPRMGRSNV